MAPLPGEDPETELSGWLAASSRFLAFAEANRDKIRKKLRTASDPGSRGDARAELAAAYCLLADRRIELAFEAYGSGQRGPDFTVTFRSSHRFNLEVTRPRPREGNAATKMAGRALLGKLKQLPADAPNVVLIAGGVSASDAELAAEIRDLKRRADGGDSEYFATRGLTLDEFQTQHRRVALVLAGSSTGLGVHSWVNPEARRRLPEGAVGACVAALAPARWR